MTVKPNDREAVADAQLIVLCYSYLLAKDPRNDTVRKQLDAFDGVFGTVAE